MSDTYRITIGGGVSPAVFASLDRFRASIGGVSNVLGGLGTKIAGALGAYSLLHTAVGALKDADDMGKFAQEVGIAVEQLSKLKYAADLSGAGDTFRTAMLKFSGVVADAQIEGSKAAKMFEELGIAVQGRETSAVLDDVADKFASWGDGAKKAAWSSEFFGTRNARMIVMLNGGADGLRKMGEQAEKFGLVLSADVTHILAIILAVFYLIDSPVLEP